MREKIPEVQNTQLRHAKCQKISNLFTVLVLYFFFFFFLDEVSSLIFKKNLHKRVLINEKEIMNFDFQNTGL